MSTQTGSGFVRHAVRLLDAATTPHGIGGYLELVAPTWSRHEIRARIVSVDHRAAGTVTLTLRPNRHWHGFRAGQHTLVTVEIDGIRHARCYSLASSAHRRDGLIELTVKAHRGGTVSRHLVDHAEPGLVVSLSPAQGNFVLPEPRPARLVLISGGSGITPVMSMLRTLNDEGHDGPIRFLHYARTPTDNPYRDELAAMPANVDVVTVATSGPGGRHFAPDHLEGGRHAAALADAPASDEALAFDEALASDDAEVFVCGPAPLRHAVRQELTVTGRVERYHDEAFGAPETPGTAPDGDAKVTFTASGRSVDNDGRSLLQQAQAAGLSPKYGCGMGICHTCTTHLTSGSVRNIGTGDVLCARADSRPVPIQICIHAPAGDVAIDL